MKKKIIKFYFFKQTLRQPGLSYLFCFTKKFIKQNKRFQNLAKYAFNLTNRKQRQKFTDIVEHRNELINKLLFNQWVFNNITHTSTFKSSGILAKHTNNRLISFKLWFDFCCRYNKQQLKQLNQYNNTGIISSHFIHILLRKNISYQTRSKYRAHISDLVFNAGYIRVYLSLIQTYTTYLNTKIYSIFFNINKNKYVFDQNYNIVINNWSVSKTLYTQHCDVCATQYKSICINNLDFKYSSLDKPHSFKVDIQKYITELDSTKKNDTKSILLTTLGHENADILPAVILYYWNAVFTVTANTQANCRSAINYHEFYKYF